MIDLLDLAWNVHLSLWQTRMSVDKRYFTCGDVTRDGNSTFALNHTSCGNPELALTSLFAWPTFPDPKLLLEIFAT